MHEGRATNSSQGMTVGIGVLLFIAGVLGYNLLRDSGKVFVQRVREAAANPDARIGLEQKVTAETVASPKVAPVLPVEESEVDEEVCLFV